MAGSLWRIARHARVVERIEVAHVGREAPSDPHAIGPGAEPAVDAARHRTAEPRLEALERHLSFGRQPRPDRAALRRACLENRRR